MQAGAIRQAPQRSRSIVANLDVPERDLEARPRRLVPGSMALVVVSLLVLGVAGGGGYLAWQRTQVETAVEVPVEPTLDPEPPPAVEVVEEVPPSLGPELPPATTTPTTPTTTTTPPTTPTTPTTPAKTAKTEKTEKTEKPAKSSTPKKSSSSSSSGKTEKPTKSSSGSTKKVEPVDDPLEKRKEQADAADPGRVLVELEYLSAIDKALKASNWAQALAYIEQHDRELPGGQLVDKFDERRIRALCGMGRASEAQTKVNQILAKRPASKVKAALAESCK